MYIVMAFFFLLPVRMAGPARALEFVEANKQNRSLVYSQGSPSAGSWDGCSLTSKLLLLPKVHPALEPETHQKRIPALSEVLEGLIEISRPFPQSSAGFQ